MNFETTELPRRSYPNGVLSLEEVGDLQSGTHLTLEIKPSGAPATFLHASIQEMDDESVTLETNLGDMILSVLMYGMQWRLRMIDPTRMELFSYWEVPNGPDHV